MKLLGRRSSDFLREPLPYLILLPIRNIYLLPWLCGQSPSSGIKLRAPDGLCGNAVVLLASAIPLSESFELKVATWGAGGDLNLDLSIFSTVISMFVYTKGIKALPGIPHLPRVHESLPFTYTAGILNTLFCFDWTPVKLNSIFPSAAPRRDHCLLEKGSIAMEEGPLQDTHEHATFC